jgi:endonuclease YncB( thermonuclease family)
MPTPARVLVLVGLIAAVAAPAAAQPNLAYVTRVAEGDLIYAEVGGRIEAVRYLGVNTPVVDHPARGREPYAAVVRERNRQLVEGKWVRLTFEREPRDEHGRLQAYVYIGEVFVNAAMLHYGWAEAAAPRADVRYSDYFRGLEEGARRDRRGLWRYGDVLAYYKRGGLEQAGDTDYQGRPAIGAGGRVFSAPAPFIPSAPSPGSGGSVAAPAAALPAAAPPPTSTRPVPPVRSGTMGRGY